MPWVIGFVSSWILFILLVDRKNLKVYIWGGILALILATFVDWGSQQLKLYKFSNLIIPFFNCSAFYKFGPTFTMGILVTQTIPKSKTLQAVNILVLSAIYAAFEYATKLTGVAEYIHWNLLASIVFDILVFSAITWFSLAFLKPRAVRPG